MKCVFYKSNFIPFVFIVCIVLQTFPVKAQPEYNFNNYPDFHIPLLKDSLRTARHHPMQYYFYLPNDWKPDRKWPVVIILEAAEKQFALNAVRFRKAGKNMPFILAAPCIVSNGNYGLKDPAVYSYSSETWNLIEREGVCNFDLTGLQEIIKDIQTDYNGSQKVFITGFEAGAHLLWAIVFLHPEMFLAAAPVAGNYRGRCLEEIDFSKDHSKIHLPVKGFYGSDDDHFGKSSQLYGQWLEAKSQAIKNGFQEIGEVSIPGKGHIPLPKEVLEWFLIIWQKSVY